MKIKAIIIFYLAISLSFMSFGQNIQMPKEMIMTYSQQWKGERFPDGRPKVSDDLVKRLANISIEEAWGVLRNKGYNNQYEGDWQIIWPDSVMTGRVVTAQYMPLRPDFDKLIKEVFSDVQDRVKYKRKVKENRCPLVLNDIVEFTDSGFTFLNYVRLSDTAMDIFLGGYKDTIKKEFKPKMGNLIYPNNIDWEKLYYNPAEREQIETLITALDDVNYKDLIERMKFQGMKAGFSVLLYGYPGTGKTSSVKQIAKTTGRSIYMVEIDKIQSKWVGESEKNLAKVFEEYKYCKKYFNIDPILLFNEADAILGKRFNVNSAVDKTFNALQNILLQELEDFEGIFMATTNLADQLDKAFDRRLLYKVDFQKPEKSISKKILGHAFSYLTEEIIEKINDCYTLTGGQIANIRKKLLVKSILKKDLILEEYVQLLCKEENILNQNNRTTIGFTNKTN